MRMLYLIIGLVLTPLGVAGVILPGLPGTILLIIAAACFARSSPRLERWLVTHPRLGPAIVDWRDRRAIALHSKIVAVLAMAGSGVLMMLTGAPALAKAASLIILAGSALYVATRPGR